MDREGWAAIASISLAVLTLLTVVWNSVFNWFIAKRDREWKMEDEKRHQVTTEQIAANTALTQETKNEASKAYTEANSMNEKLKDASKVTMALAESIKRDARMRTRSTDKEVGE